MDADPVRLIPHGRSPVVGAVDFRAPRRIGAASIDHAFTDLGFDADGRSAARLRHRDGSGVMMTWDTACRWVQVHTADRPEPQANRIGLVLEPMTCAPDGFNSGEGLVTLRPGHIHEASWQISALTAEIPAPPLDSGRAWAERGVEIDRYVAWRLRRLLIDARDPVALGNWWREFEIRPAANRLPGLLFVPVPDSKTLKNRLHLDFRPDDRDVEVERLLALGVTRADIGQGERSWIVLADPEENEFCVLGSRTL